MSGALMASGAVIFTLLGVAHTVFTLQSTPTGGPMMPTDPDIRAAMAVPGGLGMAPEIESTMYRSWIGFNLSHSLGLLLAGGVLLVHSFDLDPAVGEPWFVVVAVVVPMMYLVLAQRYWFDKPRDAIALASLLTWAGLVVALI